MRKLEKYISNLNCRRFNNLEHIDRTKIKVSVVQQKLKIFKSVKDYVNEMFLHVNKACKKGSQLVCFPEENGILLLGTLPFANEIIKFATSQQPSSGESKPLNLLPVFKIITPFLKNNFITIFSQLAKKFSVYIMSGSIMIAEDNKIVNRAYLFDPNGELVGYQDKAHLVTTEMAMGLTPATELKVFNTKIGCLAFPVCMDATYYETFKIVKNLGAEIVIIPIANMEEYNYHFALRGIWPRVQEVPVYGLKSALVGDLHGLKFTGKSGVFAPLSLTKNNSGVLIEAESFNSGGVLTATLNLDALRDYKNPYTDDTNTILYKKYLPEIYLEGERY